MEISQSVVTFFNRFLLDPAVSCTVIQYDPDECKSDADCISKHGCFNGVCKNLCQETNPCGKNAICSVKDTLPVRTMVGMKT